MKLFQDTKGDFKAGFMTKTEFREANRRMSARFIAEIVKILEMEEFRTHAWCFRCDTFCPIEPWSDESLRRALWFEAAGKT